LDNRSEGLSQALASLTQLGEDMTERVAAEARLTQARIVADVSARIADVSAGMLRLRARASLLWSAAALGGVLLAALVAGVILGSVWGAQQAARQVTVADATLRAVAVQEGAAAAEQWRRLMRWNPIGPVMARCSGENVVVEGGRKACAMTVWIEAPPQTAAGGAR
jgi:hypothetical protein